MNGKVRSVKMLPFVESKVGFISNDALSFRVAVHYHLLYLRRGHFLSQFFGCGQKVFLADESFPIFVEILKNTLDILVSIALVRLLGHHFDEFPEGDLTTVVGVEVTHGHVDEGPAGLVAAVVSDGLAQIHGSEHAVVVVVQVVEDLLEDLDLSY